MVEKLFGFLGALYFGVGIIPKNEVYADQDNTSKSEFIWLRGGVICFSFVALARIRG